MGKSSTFTKRIFILFIVCVFIGIIYFYYCSDSTKVINPGKLVIPEPNKIEEELTPLKVKKEGLYPNAYINGVVSRIVDGDTITVKYKRETLKVRLLDVDTPESVKQGVPVQAYAKEAAQFAKKNLLNKKVRLFFERS